MFVSATGSPGWACSFAARNFFRGFRGLGSGCRRFGQNGRLFVFFRDGQVDGLIGGFLRFFRLFGFLFVKLHKSPKVRIGSLPSFMALVIGMKGFGLALG